jgi:hypothetical protein
MYHLGELREGGSPKRVSASAPHRSRCCNRSGRGNRSTDREVCQRLGLVVCHGILPTWSQMKQYNSHVTVEFRYSFLVCKRRTVEGKMK